MKYCEVLLKEKKHSFGKTKKEYDEVTFEPNLTVYLGF